VDIRFDWAKILCNGLTNKKKTLVVRNLFNGQRVRPDWTDLESHFDQAQGRVREHIRLEEGAFEDGDGIGRPGGRDRRELEPSGEWMDVDEVGEGLEGLEDGCELCWWERARLSAEGHSCFAHGGLGLGDCCCY
jgi:hypothetical protein